MNVRELTSRFVEQISMSAGRISMRTLVQSGRGVWGADKLDRGLSHSARERDVLDLCVGHGNSKYIRVLDAPSCC